jgi:hypothetical protein
MKNGKTTYLTEAQITVILEKMKTANSRYDASNRNPAYNWKQRQPTGGKF